MLSDPVIPGILVLILALLCLLIGIIWSEIQRLKDELRDHRHSASHHDHLPPS
jgi:hypothetical protein